MPIITTKDANGEFIAAVDTFAESASGAGAVIEVSKCDVTVQVSGTATAISVRLQRSTVYPGADGSLGNWAPVDDAITGDLTAGVNASVYVESDHAWWRAAVTTVTGGNLTTSVSGTVAN
jgi:uncharacterized protein YjlB